MARESIWQQRNLVIIVFIPSDKKKISRRLTKIFNAIADKDTRYAAAVPVEVETHAGEEVGIFAKGCHAHLFSSVMNQNTIPHIMAYAACIGPGLKSCD